MKHLPIMLLCLAFFAAALEHEEAVNYGYNPANYEPDTGLAMLYAGYNGSAIPNSGCMI